MDDRYLIARGTHETERRNRPPDRRKRRCSSPIHRSITPIGEPHHVHEPLHSLTINPRTIAAGLTVDITAFFIYAPIEVCISQPIPSSVLASADRVVATPAIYSKVWVVASRCELPYPATGSKIGRPLIR